MKKILVVGLFLSEQNKNKIYRTAADQLAELLSKYQYPVIKVSCRVNKFFRLADTLLTILLKSNQYTVAIVPLYGGTASLFWAESATVLLKLLGKKTILIIHGGSIPGRMKTKPSAYLRTIKRVNTAVCPSGFIIETLKQYHVKAVLIENVLNLKQYHFHPKEKFRPYLFWMRTFEDAYNPLMAVRVLALLKKKYPTAKMVMAGRDTGMLPVVKRFAGDLFVLDSIGFPGYVSDAEKNRIADEYDIHICTNKIDNAPVSVIEMMGLGLPIVSVNSGGIPYLVTDNVDGLLVNPDDDEQMVEKIITIIEDNQKGKRLVENSQKTILKYDEEVIIKKWKSLFSFLIGFAS